MFKAREASKPEVLLNVADSLWARITKLDAFPLALVGSISAAIVGSLSYTLPTVMGILMATFFASVLLMRFFTRPQHESFIAAPAKGHWPRWTYGAAAIFFTCCVYGVAMKYVYPNSKEGLAVSSLTPMGLGMMLYSTSEYIKLQQLEQQRRNAYRSR